MDAAQVRKALIEALRKSLENGGASLPEIGESTIVVDILGLESEDWPYAMEEIGQILGVEIPAKVNLFIDGSGKTKRKRTVSQVIDAIIRLEAKGGL